MVERVFSEHLQGIAELRFTLASCRYKRAGSQHDSHLARILTLEKSCCAAAIDEGPLKFDSPSVARGLITG